MKGKMTVNTKARDMLLWRLAGGEFSLTEAFSRAYVWTGDPDHGAGRVMGLLCEAVEMGQNGHPVQANEKVQSAAEEVVMLRLLHPEHNLLRLLESLLRSVAESRDAGILIGWRQHMASDSLRDAILAA